MYPINLSEIIDPKYFINEKRSKCPCLICGRNISKPTEENRLMMGDDGNVYFVDEDPVEGEKVHDVYYVGADCMKMYRKIRQG